MSIVKFQDPEIERYILAACLKGPEFWKDIPDIWFNEILHQKIYKEFKKILKPPYSSFPTLNTVLEKTEDNDVKLSVIELSNIEVNVQEINIKVQDLFSMFCSRKVYDIALKLPEELEKKDIRDIVRDKISAFSQLMNPLTLGNHSREFIYDSAIERWLHYKGVEDGTITNTAIPFHIEELDKYTNGGLRKSHMMLIIAGTGDFKCVEENTILTDIKTGLQYSIKDVVEQKLPIQMLGLNAANLDTPIIKPCDFVDSGQQEVFEVLLQSGRKLLCPDHHPVFTSNLKWTKIRDLDLIKDRVAVPRKYPFPSIEDIVKTEEHKVKLLAYMIAEGNLQGMTFTNTNTEIMQDFKNCVKLMNDRVDTLLKPSEVVIRRFQESDDSYFEVVNKFIKEAYNKFKTSSEFDKHSGVFAGFLNAIQRKRPRVRQETLQKACKNVGILYSQIDPELVLCNRGSRLRYWFHSIGLQFNTSSTKKFPDIVFQWDEDTLCLFLGILWSCDGHVTKQGAYSYSSASENLIYQLQHLLLRFGIFSKISAINSSYKTPDGEKRYFKSFCLNVRSRNSRLIFYEKIHKYLVTYKKQRSEKCIQRLLKMPSNPNLDTIPFQSILSIISVARLQQVLIKAGKSPRGVSGNKYISKGLSENLLVQILPFFKDGEKSKLSALIGKNIYWDKIVSIVPKGVKKTYDLSVCKYHSFTANDIYVHNTVSKLSLAYNMAFIEKKDTMVLTLEVPGSGDQRDYQMMIDARHSLLEFKDIVNSSLNINRSVYREKLIDISEQKYPLYIVDIPDKATSADVIKELELYFAKTGKYPEFVIIDYLNEMEPVGPYNGTSEKFKQLGSELRVICRSYGTRIITSMQLNREGKKIKDGEKRDLENVSESHYVTNPFQVIVFLHRDANGIDEATNQLHWTIRKNRYGQKNVTFSTFANAPFCYVGDRKVIYPGFEQ